MGIKDRLLTQGSLASQYDGQTPPNWELGIDSKLHNLASVSGNPSYTSVTGRPNIQASRLDRNNGITPPKYSDKFPS